MANMLNPARAIVLVAAILIILFIDLSWIVRVIPSDKHTIAVFAFASIPHLSYLSRSLYPPNELEAHAQVPRHDPVPLNTGDEGVKPVQQQLSHCSLP
nr:hypothetical protein 5 [bacterium]